jgi:hypothetical protein
MSSSYVTCGIWPKTVGFNSLPLGRVECAYLENEAKIATALVNYSVHMNYTHINILSTLAKDVNEASRMYRELFSNAGTRYRQTMDLTEASEENVFAFCFATETMGYTLSYKKNVLEYDPSCNPGEILPLMVHPVEQVKSMIEELRQIFAKDGNSSFIRIRMEEKTVFTGTEAVITHTGMERISIFKKVSIYDRIVAFALLITSYKDKDQEHSIWFESGDHNDICFSFVGAIATKFGLISNSSTFVDRFRFHTL